MVVTVSDHSVLTVLAKNLLYTMSDSNRLCITRASQHPIQTLSGKLNLKGTVLHTTTIVAVETTPSEVIGAIEMERCCPRWAQHSVGMGDKRKKWSFCKNPIAFNRE